MEGLCVDREPDPGQLGTHLQEFWTTTGRGVVPDRQPERPVTWQKRAWASKERKNRLGGFRTGMAGLASGFVGHPREKDRGGAAAYGDLHGRGGPLAH
jgi:hypothetical protein